MSKLSINASKLPIPTNTAPDEWRCFCVPVPDDPEWIAAFIGCFNRLSLQNSWVRDTSNSAKTIAGQWREIMFMVQSQVSNPCCGGGTFIDQRNIINQRTIINQQNYGITQNFVTQWVDASNDVTVVFNDCPDTYWDGDSGDTGDEIAQRAEALCLAATSLVDVLMEQLQDWILGAAPDLAAIVTSSTVIPYLNIPVWILGWSAATLGAIAYDIAGDADYREWMSCCIRSNLSGQSVNSLVSFQGALPNPACSGRPEFDVVQGEVADQIENWVRAQLRAEENYLGFASIMGTAFDVAGQIEFDCPCPDDEWVRDYRFDESDHGFVSRPVGGLWGAHYVTGVGWESTGSGGESQFGVSKLFGSCSITKYQVIGTTLSGNPQNHNFAEETAAGAVGFVHSWNNNLGNIVEVSLTKNSAAYPYLLIAVNDYVSFRLERLRVWGTGTPPNPS